MSLFMVRVFTQPRSCRNMRWDVRIRLRLYLLPQTNMAFAFLLVMVFSANGETRYYSCRMKESVNFACKLWQSSHKNMVIIRAFMVGIIQMKRESVVILTIFS